MAERLDLRERQLAFTAHLRSPDRLPPPPDVDARRLALYRDLVFRNLASLLASSFPVLRRTLGASAWSELVRDFLSRHRARTPHFMELPQELLHFLATTRAADPRDPPFLLELAHYEWAELALRICDLAADTSRILPDGDLLSGRPLVSPLAWSLTYRFPVHRLGPGFQPAAAPPEPTQLVAYRTAQGEVAFLEVNAVTQRLLILLRQGSVASGRAALLQIAAELAHPAPRRLLGFGAELLQALHAKGILLGTRAPEQNGEQGTRAADAARLPALDGGGQG